MRFIVTGSAQGIGAETARQLIAQGHQVVVHGRNERRAEQALVANPAAVGAVYGDFANLAQTRRLARAAADLGPYDGIVHNAGVGGGFVERVLTDDGLETIFQVNTVAPYLMTCLMPLAPRMVYLTSGLEADGVFDVEDLNWERREWDGMQAYSDSKLFDSMLAVELASRHPDLRINAVDPGWIQTQMGGPNAPDALEEGAETQVWLMTSTDPAAQGNGQYLKRREAIAPNPAVHDSLQRAELVSVLENITGERLP